MKKPRLRIVGGNEPPPFEHIARRLRIEAMKLDVVRASLEDMGHAELSQKVLEACTELDYDAAYILGEIDETDFELEEI